MRRKRPGLLPDLVELESELEAERVKLVLSVLLAESREQRRPVHADRRHGREIARSTV